MKENNMYHRNLEFPVNFLPYENVTAFMAPLLYKYGLKFDSNERQFYILPTSEIPAEFSDWFHKTFPDIKIGTWEIFYTPANQSLPIHSDGFQPFIDFVKINYVYGSPDSTMDWYSVPAGTQVERGLNEHNRAYSVPDPTLCKKEFSANIKTPSLVNVGQLHGVDNTNSTTGRWCFCLVPINPSLSPSRLEFGDSLQIFKDYICG